MVLFIMATSPINEKFNIIIVVQNICTWRGWRIFLFTGVFHTKSRQITVNKCKQSKITYFLKKC